MALVTFGATEYMLWDALPCAVAIADAASLMWDC